MMKAKITVRKVKMRPIRIVNRSRFRSIDVDPAGQVAVLDEKLDEIFLFGPGGVVLDRVTVGDAIVSKPVALGLGLLFVSWWKAVAYRASACARHERATWGSTGRTVRPCFS